MATKVGTAIIEIQFDGKNVKAKLREGLGDMEKEGKKSGKSFANAWAVAAGNLIADGIKKVGSVISGAMDSAMSRVDTLNNFPKVMQSLGYSAEESASSIQLIGDKLDGLPTSLDGMASDVQKLAATMGNLNTGMVNATTVGLSLNNMFLAGGKGTEAASAAMEQYNQMLARGKVDMQSWNSMVNAAPGQMDQLAKSILGANANQQDLYQAMQAGTVSFDEFNETLVRLNEEGGENFASFTDQAIAATGGFQTQLQNIKTSLTKVVAAALSGDFEAMVKGTQQLVDRIVAILPQLVEGFTMAFQGIVSIVPELLSKLAPIAMDALKNIATTIVQGIPVLIDAITAILPDIIQAVVDIGIAIANELPRIITSVINALTVALPRIALAITDIVISVVDVLTKPENLTMILNAALNLLMEIVKAIPTILERLIAALPTIIKNIVDFLVNPATITAILNGAIQMLMAIVQALPRIITQLAAALPQIITTIVGCLTNPEFLQAIINGAIELLMGIIKALPQILIALVEALPQIIESIVSFLLDPNNLQKIIEGAIQLFFGLVKAVPQILGALLNAFGELVGKLWEWITQKFKDFAGSFGETIGRVFKNAINGVLTFIENFINGPIDLINGAIDLINNIPGVDIGHVPRIQLGRMAEGGAASQATAAIFGEAGTEVVLPLERNQDNWAGLLASTLAKEMDYQGNSSNRPITVYMTNEINNEMDAEDIGRKLMTSIRRAA